MEQQDPKKSFLSELKGTGWIIIYPIYLASDITIERGRRVSKEIGVPHVLLPDVMEALRDLKFEFAIEDKAHPHFFHIRGRCRVKLFNDDKTPVNSEIPNKKALFNALCKQIKINREKKAEKAPQNKKQNKKKK